jgi:hypothetical protein
MAFGEEGAHVLDKAARQAGNAPELEDPPAPAHEFGTGFLPPETGAQKRRWRAMSPSRDQRLETTTREKWPQKRPLLLASCQLRVSGDWVVGAPGLEPGTR